MLEVGQFAGVGRVFFAKVEFEFMVFRFVVEHQAQFGGEGPASLAAKAFQRADARVAQQRFHFGRVKCAAAGNFADGEAAAFAGAVIAGAGVAAVVFLHHAAAGGAWGVQRGVFAGHGIAVVFLGLGDDALGHGGNVAHEGVAVEPAMFDLRKLVFPVAGQRRLAQFFHLQATQERHELEGLGGGDEFAPFAQQVFFGEQPFDDGRARGRRAQTLFLHGFAQFVVFDPFAGAFHGAQQRGFAVAGGRPGFQALGFGVLGAHHFAGLDRHQ